MNAVEAMTLKTIRCAVAPLRSAASSKMSPTIVTMIQTSMLNICVLYSVRESVYFVVCTDGFQENRLLALMFDETKNNSKVIAKGTGPEPVEFSPELVSLEARMRCVLLKKMQNRGKRLPG